MPKEITHCLFAEKAVHALAASDFPLRRAAGRELLFLFEKQKEALLFGSVAPDIFYYDIAVPWEKKGPAHGAIWGDLIHGAHGEDTLRHVREMLQVLREPGLQAPLTGGRPLSRDEHSLLLLFVMGYLAHVALDTLMHPFVYYYSGNYYAEDAAEKMRSEARHRAIETVYDLWNLERFGTTLAKYRPRARIYLRDEPRYLVLGLLALGLLRAWPQITAQEFGTGELPLDIRQHALFKIAHRSYKKQLLLNKMFQSRSVARFGLWLNARRKDALHANSSLLYPAATYRQYLAKAGKEALVVESFRDYRDPVNNRQLPFSPERIERRILARTQGMYRIVWSYMSGVSGADELNRRLRGFSLNNGRTGVATSAMRHFSPLAIDGNFRFGNQQGVQVS
ncbi:MAG TPA: zinc dependent phospholipase C family protein [Turneriella sp.]|nr:zinc dependent phospholipase C family protein [Turneriella sp.]